MPIKYATPDQVGQLLDRAKAASVRDYTLFVVMYWRGLRASEASMIQLSDWKPESGRLFVHRLKGSNSGEYLVSPDEKKAITDWVRVRGPQPGPMFPSRHGSRNGSGIGRRMLDNLVKRYAPSDWPDDLKHCHTLRHSIAVHLLEKGMELIAVQDWLGHRSILSTMEYVAFTSPTRRRAEKLAYEEPGQDRTTVGVDWKADKKTGKRNRKPAKPA